MKQNIFNSDFQDFIVCLNQANVSYMLVGGYSVILHGHSRTTGDLDVWVEPEKKNFGRLLLAFKNFGLPTCDMSESKFLNTIKYDVFTFGRPPVAIDIMTKVKGLSFQEAYSFSEIHQLEEDFYVRSLSKADLLTAKRAAGRTKDLGDLEELTKK